MGFPNMTCSPVQKRANQTNCSGHDFKYVHTLVAVKHGPLLHFRVMVRCFIRGYI